MEIFGYRIPQPDDLQESEDQVTYEERFKDLKCKEHIRRALECQIWFRWFDLNKNLQWWAWSKTYWFSCLLKWMLEKSAWPNWRTALHPSNVRVNNKWEKYFSIIETEANEQIGIKWEKHQEKWSCYCTEWLIWIWHKWLIEDTHKKHKVIENNEASEVLLYKVEKRLRNKTTDFMINSDCIDQLENNLKLINTIYKDAAEPLYKSINEIWSEFNSENDEFLNNQKQRLDSAINACKQKEMLLEQYKKSKDPCMIEKISQTLIASVFLRNEANDLLETVNKQLEKDELKLNKDFEEYSVSWSLSDIVCNKSTRILINTQPNNLLLFIAKKEENFVNLCIDFDQSQITEWYCKIDLNKNDVCKLEDVQFVKVNWKDGSIQINRLIINLDEYLLNPSNQINFSISILKTNEDIENRIKNIKKSVLQQIVKKQYGEDADIIEENKEVEGHIYKELSYDQELPINSNDSKEDKSKTIFNLKKTESKLRRKSQPISMIKEKKPRKTKQKKEKWQIKQKNQPRKKKQERQSKTESSIIKWKRVVKSKSIEESMKGGTEKISLRSKLERITK